jgi:hypothetical protein
LKISKESSSSWSQEAHGRALHEQEDPMNLLDPLGLFNIPTKRTQGAQGAEGAQDAQGAGGPPNPLQAIGGLIQAAVAPVQQILGGVLGNL